MALTTVSRRLWNLLKVFSNSVFFKLKKMLLLSLLFHRFIGLAFNCAARIIIKGIAIWGLRRPDVRVDVVAEIFCQPTLRPVAIRSISQQPLPWTWAPLSPPDTCCRCLCWIWGHVGRWMKAWRHHRSWLTQTRFSELCLVSIDINMNLFFD